MNKAHFVSTVQIDFESYNASRHPKKRIPAARAKDRRRLTEMAERMYELESSGLTEHQVKEKMEAEFFGGIWMIITFALQIWGDELIAWLWKELMDFRARENAA